MEFLSGYMHKLIASALICTLALMLTPKGRVKKAVTFVCGAVMLAAVIAPITGLDFDEYSKALTEYKLKAEEYSGSGSENLKNLNRIYIQDSCRAYILDKAKSEGICVISASVEVKWSDEGFWYPVKADIESSCSGEDMKRLSAYIEAELGISREKQNWSNSYEEDN